MTVLRGDGFIGVRGVGSRFRFREGATASSISAVSSGECSSWFEAFPCVNRDREGRVLLRADDETVVALMIFEVSFEILEVLISKVG